MKVLVYVVFCLDWQHMNLVKEQMKILPQDMLGRHVRHFHLATHTTFCGDPISLVD